MPAFRRGPQPAYLVSGTYSSSFETVVGSIAEQRQIFKGVADLQVRFLPDSELERNREAMARFGSWIESDRGHRAVAVATARDRCVKSCNEWTWRSIIDPTPVTEYPHGPRTLLPALPGGHFLAWCIRLGRPRLTARSDHNVRLHTPVE